MNSGFAAGLGVGHLLSHDLSDIIAIFTELSKFISFRLNSGTFFYQLKDGTDSKEYKVALAVKTSEASAG